ncbi:hypothetical protein D3C87_2133250 [compost metagenome]
MAISRAMMSDGEWKNTIWSRSATSTSVVASASTSASPAMIASRFCLRVQPDLRTPMGMVMALLP